MKNNKLTLKSLKQELENLKKDSLKSNPLTETHKHSVAHDIKNSYIQNLHMKSSMFILWILSWVIFFVHKFPLVSKVVTFLSLVYGRTTWWKSIIYIRKVFIVFNAIIGVYIVYKSTGFGLDTFWANFIAIGNTYIDIFTNFSKRLFNWFLETLDYKVVPNVPGNSGGTWFNNPKPSVPSVPSVPKGRHIFVPSNISIPEILNTDSLSLRSSYKDSIDSLTPWYKDLSTWFMIGCGV